MIPSREEAPIKCFAVASFVCRGSEAGMDVLLIRRAAGYLGVSWQMVSGKIEKGEKAWEAALREIREETGITPDRFYSADRLETFYEVSQNCINLIPVFVAFVDSEQKVVLSSEHTEFQWVPYARVGDYVEFAHQAENARWIYSNFVEHQPSRFLKIKIKNEQAPNSEGRVTR